MAIVEKKVGKLPVYKGDWSATYNDGHGYMVKNRVTIFGSELESLIDNNTYVPATRNEQTGVVTFDEHWKVISNGSQAYAAALAATNKMAELEEEWDDQDQRMTQMQATINAKQLEVGAVQTDEVPTENSGNHMTSGDIYQTLKNSAKGFVDDEPTAGSDNLVKSAGIKNELALGAVYDVSAKNPTAGPNSDGKWESLSALLSDANLNTLIPTAARKGGMSIKFVQSSDNKYVQYFLTKDEWSAREIDWEKTNLEEEVNQLSANACLKSGVVQPSGNLASSYVNTIGNIVQWSACSVNYYAVNPGEKYYLDVYGQVGSSFSYGCFYSDIQFGADTLIENLGPAATIETELFVEVPARAQYLAINNYAGHGNVYGATSLKDEIVTIKQDNDNIWADLGFDENETTDISVTKNPGKYITTSGELADGGPYFYSNPILLNKGWYIINGAGYSNSVAILSMTDESASIYEPLISDNEPIGGYNLKTYIYYLPVDGYFSVSARNTTTFSFKKINNETGLLHYISQTKILEGTKECAYSYDGKNLYIAYNNGLGKEFTFWFKKCLNNNLFTFYMVGYRSVSRNTPSTQGIESNTGITIINPAYSDNIGPLEMVNGGWVGGNHLYSNTSVKTAQTDSINISADGKTILPYTKGYCKNIVIKVSNTIFDPAFPPSSGDTILPVPLSKEYVTYSIVKNTIEVGVTQQFEVGTTNKCRFYFGMQSMALGETHLITPNGLYNSWTEVDNETLGFNKDDYPNFNRFIEKKVSVNKTWYQSTYLIPTFGLGTKSHISQGGQVFARGSEKDYHICINETETTVAGKTMQWGGSYTFFDSALIDDGVVLVYRGTIRGKDALFISASGAYSGIIQLPNDFMLRSFSVVENYGFTNEDGGATFETGGRGIAVVSLSGGSLIIRFD